MSLVAIASTPAIVFSKALPVRVGSLRLSLGIVQHSSDVLLPGFGSPMSHGALGGSAEIQLGIARRWLVSASGHALGSWFDYNNGLDSNGKSTELEPGCRLGIDRVILETTGDTQALVGAGLEYNEVRSWVHNRVFTIPFNLTGPRNFIRGVSFRGSVVGPSWSRIRPLAQASELLYLAKAEDPAVHSRYHWIGRSASLQLGLTVELGGP